MVMLLVVRQVLGVMSPAFIAPTTGGFGQGRTNRSPMSRQPLEPTTTVAFVDGRRSNIGGVCCGGWARDLHAVSTRHGTVISGIHTLGVVKYLGRARITFTPNLTRLDTGAACGRALKI